MPNVPVNNSYPAVEFQPTESSGVNHNDQEFTDPVSGNSYMFRAYNAQYISGTGWEVFDGSLPAFATVQNPDGSIHYYTLNTGTGLWEGSDNNTVYNGVDFGLVAPGGGSASVNTAALQSLFAAMVAPAGLPGGTAWIPQYNYPVNTALALNAPAGAIFQGLGTGGVAHSDYAFHFSISDGETAASTFISTTGTHTSGGTKFRNLAFQWVSPEHAGDTCLNFNYFNNAAEECTFTDCPTAISFQGLGGSAIRCTLRYGKYITEPTNVTAIIMQHINCAVIGPSEMDGGGVAGAVFMSIGGGTPNCNIIHLDHLHVFKYAYGLDYSDFNDVGVGSGCQDITVSNCVFACVNSCVYMTPQSTPPNQILDQHFTDNVFCKDQDSTTADPIVYIDSNGGLPSNVGPIFFNNCLIFSNVTGGTGQGGKGDHTGSAKSGQYGLKIGTCEYVSIIGGQISQMGGNNPDVTGTANICISGNPVSVVIDSVNLLPAYAGANAGRPTGTDGSGPSQYGLLITGDPTSVTVNNCPIGPVSVTGSPGNLRITNCLGYNDQNTALNGGAAPLSALSAATCSTRYFGPSVFTWTNAAPVTVHVFGVSYTANSGIIFLPSPYDTFYMSTAPLVFSWIGK